MCGLEMLNVGEGQRVLEIGFGTGHNALELARAVGAPGRVCGVDLSARMCGITRSRLEKHGLLERVLLAQADGAFLPVGRSYFDAVFISFTLELFDTGEIPTVLRCCFEALVSGGLICVVTMAKMEKPNLISRLYEWGHRKYPQYLDCRPIYSRRSLQEAGFQVLDERRMWLAGLPIDVVLAQKID